MNKPYSAIYGSDSRPCVEGPGDGFGYSAGTLWPGLRLSTPEDALAASKLCNEAHRQGYLKAQREIRAALGLSS